MTKYEITENQSGFQKNTNINAVYAAIKTKSLQTNNSISNRSRFNKKMHICTRHLTSYMNVRVNCILNVIVSIFKHFKAKVKLYATFTRVAKDCVINSRGDKTMLNTNDK